MALFILFVLHIPFTFVSVQFYKGVVRLLFLNHFYMYAQRMKRKKGHGNVHGVSSEQRKRVKGNGWRIRKNNVCTAQEEKKEAWERASVSSEQRKGREENGVGHGDVLGFES